jgi:hypothetical protein
MNRLIEVARHCVMRHPRAKENLIRALWVIFAIVVIVFDKGGGFIAAQVTHTPLERSVVGIGLFLMAIAVGGPIALLIDWLGGSDKQDAT